MSAVAQVDPSVRLGIEGLLVRDSAEALSRVLILYVVLVQPRKIGKRPENTGKLLHQHFVIWKSVITCTI